MGMSLANPPPPIAEAPRETAVDPDGYLYDVATGEVLGQEGLVESYRVRTEDDVDAVLRRKLEIESARLAIRARRAAINANLDQLDKIQERRLAWWDYRFAADVLAVSRDKLRGGKSRTAHYAHGSVSFRTTPGTSSIVAGKMADAVDFVRRFAPSLVKQPEPTVTATDLRKAAEAYRQATDEEPNLGEFLVSSGPRESCTITTGIPETTGGAR